MTYSIQDSKNLILALISIWALSGCSSLSQEILPEKVEVKVSREQPSETCRLIGPVTGRTLSVHGTETEALQDLKSDAARKGANFVLYDQASAYGTALRGTAYFCP